MVAALARLLDPSSFGVISAILVFIALVDVFGQIGFAPALIQKSELTPQDVSTALSLSLLMGVAMAGAIFLSAPLIAALFNLPALTDPLKLVSLCFPLRAAGIISNALIRRSMKFRALAGIDLGSYILGYACVAVALAAAGMGYWALVWGQIAQIALCNLGYIIASPHASRLSIDPHSAKALLSFGGGLTMARIGNYVGMNVDYLVVGRWLGAADLGYYSRAFFLMNQPTKLIGSISDQVLFPVFSALKHEPGRVVNGYYTCITVVFLLTALASGQLFILAPDLVLLLLGAKWMAVVAPFQFFCISMPFRIAWKTSSAMMVAQGAVMRQSLWQWSYAVLIFVGAYIGQAWGITGVAAAVSLAMIVNYVVGIAVIATLYPVTLSRELAIILKCALIAVTGGGATSLLFYFVPLEGIGAAGRLSISAAIAGAQFLLVAAFLERIFPNEGAWLKARIIQLVRRRGMGVASEE
ncbi:MAG: lipopolysaccharide biosynthesis protein [Sphingobium sp.]